MQLCSQELVAQPGEGRKLVVAGASLRKDRDLQGAVQQGKWMEQGLSKQTLDRALGFAMRLSTVGLCSGVSDKETELCYPKTHCSLCYWIKEYIICKPRTIAVELLFPSVTDPQVECMWWVPTEVRGHHYSESKINSIPKQCSCTVLRMPWRANLGGHGRKTPCDSVPSTGNSRKTSSEKDVIGHQYK